MVRKFFEHEQFNFELQFALGGVHYGAGDVGEMLSTADRVVDGDADSWCREWIATGQRLAAMAEGCARSGHRVSARAAYLRAATYFAVALSSVDGTKDPAALLRGYWVPRALAFEPRIAAAIADPGVFDVFAPWSEAIPSELRQLLDSGDKQAFDQMFNEGMQSAPPAQRQNWEWRAKPYGLQSPLDVFTAARRYNLADVTDQVTTPLLINDPEGEQFWPGQSQRVFEKLPAAKRLIPFTADEGADRHCEPMARSLLEQRMFDWLNETLSAATS
jgi:hypothetical protein